MTFGYGLTRRRFLRGATAGLVAPWLADGLWPGRLGADFAELTDDVNVPTIRPRSDWGADLPPTGPLDVEAREDVRFLLVHHSASSNDYAAADVPELLRSFFRFHTTDRGWPDIAYNFLVDRAGVVWEGRQGSLTEPVKGDATGGSQGFALLACWIGDHREQPPTDAAQEAMAGLLAALAARYNIDPLGETSFVSRGSNLHPEGTKVQTRCLAGHREMSQTSCPGDVGQALVTGELPTRVDDTLAELVAAENPPAAGDAEGEGTTEADDEAGQPEPDGDGRARPESRDGGFDQAPGATAPSGSDREAAANGDEGAVVADRVAAGVAAAVLAAGGATAATAAARAVRSRRDDDVSGTDESSSSSRPDDASGR